MSKKIVINTCDDCPHCGHSGGFTPGGAYPTCGNHEVCKSRGFQWQSRTLPFKSCFDANNRPFRQYTGAIPDWCPLDNN